MAEIQITPKQLAAELGVSDKSLRSIMRRMTDKDSQPGSGGRWNIEPEMADAIRAKVRAATNRTVVNFRPKAEPVNSDSVEVEVEPKAKK